MSLTTNIDNIYKNGVIGNVRKAQEDSHDMKLKTPNGDVFVVCDGMGGHVGGAKASSLAVESILAFLNKEKYNNPIEALGGALQFANRRIIDFANEYPEFRGMGTTACILLFQGDEAWIAHVGDSRIYLYLGKEKELHRITKDHSFVQTLVDAGEITDEQAEHHPNKNRILKALGVISDLEPTFNFQNKPILPKNGDIFLICSDGLSGMIPDSTIKRVLAQKDLTLEQKGDRLIYLALEGETVQPGGQDNCTVELIKVDNSPWQKSEFKSYNPGKRKFSITGGFSSGKKGLSSKLVAAIMVLLVMFGVGAWAAPHLIREKKIKALENNYNESKNDRDIKRDKYLKQKEEYDQYDLQSSKDALEPTLNEYEQLYKEAQKQFESDSTKYINYSEKINKRKNK